MHTAVKLENSRINSFFGLIVILKHGTLLPYRLDRYLTGYDRYFFRFLAVSSSKHLSSDVSVKNWVFLSFKKVFSGR